MDPFVPIGIRTNHVTLQLLPFGLTVYRLQVSGIDTVVSLSSPSDHQTRPNFNSICGRYANRIAKGTFTLNGTQWKLSVNNGDNHLHGGTKGLWSKVFALKDKKEGPSVSTTEWTVSTPDGEEGYPGNLTVDVRVGIWEHGESEDSGDIVCGITFDITAVSDRDTVTNICNHNYWNLNSNDSKEIQSVVETHSLKIAASHYLPVDNHMIPTGNIQHVGDEPRGAERANVRHMDFRTMRAIDERLWVFREGGVDTAANGGYDHCFVVSKDTEDLSTDHSYLLSSPFAEPSVTTALAAELLHRNSGRLMKVFTSSPGIQVYTGNFLNGSLKDLFGRAIPKNGAICLETQHFPDSVNKADCGFPSPIVKANDKYRHTFIHTFHHFGK